MEVIFDYDRSKDVWCLLNRGKGSNNNPNPTKVYELLVSSHGSSPTDEVASIFINKFIVDNNIQIESYLEAYRREWFSVAKEYYKRAETIFNVSLPHNVTVYLTINNRNPYSIQDSHFFVTVPRDTVRKTVMHELWHFYTWYGLGTGQEELLGKEKYNMAKEALTVLLNVECADLLPKGISDEGYPQHQELRQSILGMWQSNKNIKSLWKQITK